MKAHTIFVRNLGTLGCALALAAGTFSLPGCSSVKGGGAATSGGGGGTGSSGNSVAIAVNNGPAMNAINIPFTSVNICVPGTSNCQTITNVLVDTGSVGLRVLGTQVTIPILKATDTNGNPLGECVRFVDNTFLWGSVSTADITMAGEKASAAPIQIVYTAGSVGFPTVPNTCTNNGAFTDAGNVSALRANGILGVGLFKEDCGDACISNPPANFYYDAGATCVPTSCALIAVPLLNQVQNPVALFTTDNNGVLISLPSIAVAGATTASGSLIFGVGTQSNNALGSAKVYTTDSFGFFTATYNNVSYPQSFIDSGSNGFFFLDAGTSGVTACMTAIGFYCPASTTNFTVTNTGNNGTTAPVMFSIANFETLFGATPGLTAFSNIGGPFPGAFDYGLPFFYGRSVFTGITGQTSPGGTGPYFAY
jgi:Protein of unknown function (DUF3443)